MRTIRQNVFETNSSSVHALVIAKEYQIENLPKVVNFNFYTESDHYDDYVEIYDIPSNNYEKDIRIKAEIIFEGLINYSDSLEQYNDLIQFIIDSLQTVNVKATFPNTSYSFNKYRVISIIPNEQKDFAEACFQNKNQNLLLRFLFGKYTIIDAYEDDTYWGTWEHFIEEHNNFEFVNKHEEYSDRR